MPYPYTLSIIPKFTIVFNVALIAPNFTEIPAIELDRSSISNDTNSIRNGAIIDGIRPLSNEIEIMKNDAIIDEIQRLSNETEIMKNGAIIVEIRLQSDISNGRRLLLMSNLINNRTVLNNFSLV